MLNNNGVEEEEEIVKNSVQSSQTDYRFDEE